MRAPVLSPRDRRALRLGALVLAPAALWFAALAPYLRAVEQTGDRLAAERELLRREVDLVARADAFPGQWAIGSERLLEVVPRTFGGRNTAMASAAVAQYVQAGATLSSVLLKQLEPGPPQEVGTGLIAVPLEVEGESDLEGVMSLLYMLETGAKLITIENLRMQGLRTVSTPDQPAVLSFTFTATGYLLSEIPEHAAGTGGGEETP